MTATIILAAIFFFIVYLLIDMFRTGNINNFFENWVKKTVWIWLPFYALNKLLREIVFKKK